MIVRLIHPCLQVRILIIGLQMSVSICPLSMKWLLFGMDRTTRAMGTRRAPHARSRRTAGGSGAMNQVVGTL